MVLVHRVSLPLAHLRFIAGRNHCRTACLAASCDIRPSCQSRSRRGGVDRGAFAVLIGGICVMPIVAILVAAIFFRIARQSRGTFNALSRFLVVILIVLELLIFLLIVVLIFLI